MTHLSKKARQIIKTYGTVGNIKRLTQEFKTLQKAEKDIYTSSKNIAKILKKKIS